MIVAYMIVAYIPSGIELMMIVAYMIVAYIPSAIEHKDQQR